MSGRLIKLEGMEPAPEIVTKAETVASLAAHLQKKSHPGGVGTLGTHPVMPFEIKALMDGNSITISGEAVMQIQNGVLVGYVTSSGMSFKQDSNKRSVLGTPY